MFNKKLIIPILLGIIGAVINSVRVPFFYESFLIIGPAITLVAVILRGNIAGVIVSVISTVPLALYWQDGWPVLIHLLECLFVGFLYKKYSKYLIFIVFSFWLFLAFPLLYFYYQSLNFMGPIHAINELTQYAINAIIYAHIATIILSSKSIVKLLSSNNTFEPEQTLKNRYTKQISIFFVSTTFIIALLILQYQINSLLKNRDKEIDLLHEKIKSELSIIIHNNFAKFSEVAPALSLIWNDESIKKDYLSEVHKRSPGYSNMSTIDINGTLLDFSLKDGLVAPTGVVNVKDRDYFNKAIVTNKPYVSDGFQGRGIGNDLIVAFSVGIPSTNNRLNLGVFYGSLNIDYFKSFSKSLNQQNKSAAIITDRENKVLFSPDKVNLSPLQKINFSNVSDKFHNNKLITFGHRETKPQNNFYYKKDTLDWGWTITTIQDETLFALSLEYLLLLIGIIMLVMVYISESVSSLLSQYWTRQLAQLSQALDYISKDGYKYTESQEYEELPNELKIVYQALENSKQKVDETNSNLSRLVDEKTNELQLANSNLQQLVRTDFLTKLYNRRYFNEMLQTTWEQHKSGRKLLSLLSIDIDYFKKINDKWGHPIGDKVLIKVAEYLLSIREPYIKHISRVGGEEFSLLCLANSHEKALNYAKEIHLGISKISIAHSESGNPEEIKITVSIGIGTIKTWINTTEKLLKISDQALYKAKRNGRNQIQSIDISED